MNHMGKEPSKTKRLTKFILIGCGSITLLIAAITIGVGVWLFGGAESEGMTPYHPFRSEKAKEEYLKLYETRAKKWPVISENRMVNTSYGQTFVRISGPAAGKPLVLLPGAGANSLHWGPNIQALSASYKTYAVDSIYDFGRSVSTRPLNNSEDLVNWLDELFNALELGGHINLMGMSYGGWLTSQYALRFPNRLGKIILLAPACTVLPVTWEFIGRAILVQLPFRYFTKSLLYWILEDMVKKDETSQVWLDSVVDDTFTAMLCFKPRPLVNPTVLTDKEIQSIKLPVLFLAGENEKIYSAQKAVQRLNKVAPQIETEIIPQAGHDLALVQAEMVNRKVLNFLKNKGFKEE